MTRSSKGTSGSREQLASALDARRRRRSTGRRFRELDPGGQRHGVRDGEGRRRRHPPRCRWHRVGRRVRRRATCRISSASTVVRSTTRSSRRSVTCSQAASSPDDRPGSRADAPARAERRGCCCSAPSMPTRSRDLERARDRHRPAHAAQRYARASTRAAARSPTSPHPFDRDLFNTYRSSTFPNADADSLAPARGQPRVVLRDRPVARRSGSESSFSTTVPGVTRGDHYHRRKVERFTVLSGRARPSRCAACSRQRSSRVPSWTGDVARRSVDMPTMWAHNITNIGERPLYTSFWTNDLFDPAAPRHDCGGSMTSQPSQGDDGRRHPTGDHPPVRDDQASRRAHRPRARAHGAELRLRAQRGVLRRPRASPSRPLPQRRHSARSAPCSGRSSRRSRRCCARSSPDAFLVLGDTNSCISAVMAKRMKIPVFHMEAGNRCFDENVPEETNRRLVDHVADYNLVYTEHARRNLLAEGHPPVDASCSPVRRCARCSEQNREQIEASDVVERAGTHRRGSTSS